MWKVYFGDAVPDLELWADIWRGWIVPVGGSTPDRLQDRFQSGNSARYHIQRNILIFASLIRFGAAPFF